MKNWIQHRNFVHATYLQPHTNKAAKIESNIKTIEHKIKQTEPKIPKKKNQSLRRPVDPSVTKFNQNSWRKMMWKQRKKIRDQESKVKEENRTESRRRGKGKLSWKKRDCRVERTLKAFGIVVVGREKEAYTRAKQIGPQKINVLNSQWIRYTFLVQVILVCVQYLAAAFVLVGVQLVLPLVQWKDAVLVLLKSHF